MPLIKLPDGREVDLNANPLGQTEGIPSNIPANHPAGWTPAYGGAPEIPNYIASAWQALGGDMDLLPGIFSMGNAYNLFNYGQRMGQVQETPGFGGVLSNLGGTLPRDVINQIAQRSAERGIGQGIPDSPNADAAYLRALGLTSLDLQNRGQQQLGSLLGQFPQAAPFNIMDFLVTPEDQQAANAAANVSAASPNPKAAADEEQRKLLEAIEAGKAAGGAGGPAGGGTDYSKLISDWLKAQSGGKGPETVVGRGPNQTADRGNNFFVPSPQDIRYNPTRYTDPGSSGYNAAGLRNDVIKNAGAGNFVNSIFKTPAYEDNAVRGGLGLDPVANALLSRERSLNNMGLLGLNTFGMNNANGTFFNGGYGLFGAPITSSGMQYDMNVNPDWGYGTTTNQNQFAFGDPITARNLRTGSYDSDWVSNIFSTPSYEYSSSVGLLDPALSAILGPGGVIGQGSMFDPGNMFRITPEDRSLLGQSLIPSGGTSYYDFGLLGGGSNMASEAELMDILGL